MAKLHCPQSNRTALVMTVASGSAPRRGARQEAGRARGGRRAAAVVHRPANSKGSKLQRHHESRRWARGAGGRAAAVNSVVHRPAELQPPCHMVAAAARRWAPRRRRGRLRVGEPRGERQRVLPTELLHAARALGRQWPRCRRQGRGHSRGRGQGVGAEHVPPVVRHAPRQPACQGKGQMHADVDAAKRQPQTTGLGLCLTRVCCVPPARTRRTSWRPCCLSVGGFLPHRRKQTRVPCMTRRAAYSLSLAAKT
eukprot:365751-Chlamydomonas_euryale.AAC.9